MVIINHTNALADAVGAVSQGINQGAELARYAEIIKDARQRRALMAAQEQRMQRMAPLQEENLRLDVESKQRRNDYEQDAMNGGADDELRRLVDGLRSEAENVSSKFFNGKLPDDVRARLGERVEMLRAIRGANPQELSAARNAFAGDIVQSLKKDLDRPLRQRFEQRLGRMVDNPAFATDEAAITRLQALQQTTKDPNAVWDPFEMHTALNSVEQAHAQRTALEAHRNDYMNDIQEELQGASLYRQMSPEIRQQLRSLQADVRSGLYDEKLDEVGKEIRKIVATGAKEDRGRGHGRKWAEADPESQAIVELAARDRASKQYAPLMKDDPELYDQMVEREVQRTLPLHAAQHGWMDYSPPGGGMGGAPSGAQAGAPGAAGPQSVVQEVPAQKTPVPARVQWQIKHASAKGDYEAARMIAESNGLDLNADLSAVEMEPLTPEQEAAWDAEVQDKNQASARGQGLRDRMKSGKVAPAEGKMFAELPAGPQVGADQQPQAAALQEISKLAASVKGLDSEDASRWVGGDLAKTKAEARKALRALVVAYREQYGEVPESISSLLKGLTPKKKK